MWSLSCDAGRGRRQDRRRGEHLVADPADLDDQRVERRPPRRGPRPRRSRRRGQRRGTGRAPCRSSGSRGQRLADRPLVRRLAALDRGDRGAVEDARRCRRSTRPTAGSRCRSRPPARRPRRPASAARPSRDELDHPLDLLLVGRAVAGDRRLDLVRGRLADRPPVLGGGQQHDAAGLADGDRRLGVAREEQPLDRDDRRLVELDQLVDAARGSPAAAPAAAGPGDVTRQP